MGLLLVLASSLAMSQTPVDPKRIDAIWTAAQNRMFRQSDYWFEAGEFLRSTNLLRFLWRLDPSNYEVATDLGWMLENVARYPEALSVYKEFRLANPNDPDAAYPEANYYFMKKEFDKVPPLLEPTLAKNPHANSFRICAHSYERSGKLKESRDVWLRYLKQSPDDEMAKANLRRIEKKIGG